MRFDFIGKKKLWLIVALSVVAIGLISMAVQGLNFGIDFTGGTRLMLHLPGGFTTAEVRDVLSEVEATDASGRKVTLENSYIQDVVGEENEVIIRTVPLTEAEREAVFAAMEAKWNGFSEDDILNVENVGPVVGGELIRNALIALVLAAAAIIVYISVRFQFKFAVAALVALLFDAFVVIAAFSIFQVELNSPFVAAILTIVGYSINDTIVIYDRIRENARIEKNMPVDQMVNKSITQSLSRSVNTNLAVFISVTLIFIFATIGGIESIQRFALPMVVGTISGCYSTVCIAGPLWVMWQKHKQVAVAK